jgi:hypothetical protein
MTHMLSATHLASVVLSPSASIRRSNRTLKRRLQRSTLTDAVDVCGRASPPLESEAAMNQPAMVEDNAHHDHAAQQQEQPRSTTDVTGELPAGCVMGMVIPRGTPVQLVDDESRTRDTAILRSIQADNYKFISHMIAAGWEPTSPKSCGFVITMLEHEQKEVWEVTGATPLHYAICCGRLQSATALLVAFPQYAQMRCEIKRQSQSTSPTLGHDQVSHWSVLDLAVHFMRVFQSKNHVRAEAYEKASLVLMQLNQDKSQLPFVSLPTAGERLRAAGDCAITAMGALVHSSFISADQE